MDYNGLLLLATDLGYGLLGSGAEIYRVEESILRLLHAYGVNQAAPFVIPNCIMVSFVTPEGEAMTQVRRMPPHGTDVDLLERYNDLCRHLCVEVPPLPEARARLDGIGMTRQTYPLPILLVAYLAGCSAFSLFFGGTLRDALCAGLCGLAIGCALTAMSALHTNLFFRTMLGSALSALLALGLVRLGLGQHSDNIIIGALMALVPGIMFTNAIRDVMAGDMVSGLSGIASALLTGVSIALGTALPVGLMGSPATGSAGAASGYLLPVLFAFLASGGFAIVYNIHGTGILICAFGGALGWLAHLLSGLFLHSDITQALLAAVAISLYAELMARIRKCPVTGYLLVAFFPLVPGGGIYYTMEHAMSGDAGAFLSAFLHTLGVAGTLAVGVLLVSSAVRMGTDLCRRYIKGGRL